MFNACRSPAVLTPLVALGCLARAATAFGLPPDVDTLIRGLARKAPASVAFTEARFSALLKEPLVVSGELEYAGPASLDRRVTEPYRESTAIRGESVRLERDGEPERTFALKRVPELRALLSGFVALLSGDATSIRKDFSVESGGDDASWRLELKPVEASARRRLMEIVVNGSGGEPRCFSMLDTRGGGSVLLLGAAAAKNVRKDATLEDLLSLCRAE
jgi:Outer membrane lipoprotein carrier protein LolA-like